MIKQDVVQSPGAELAGREVSVYIEDWQVVEFASNVID
jgi:hypothetical protein